MEEWPTQKFIKALPGFVGLTGYCQKFVKNYVKISAPLLSIWKKDAFKWNKEATQVFIFLKHVITTTPTIGLHD